MKFIRFSSLFAVLFAGLLSVGCGGESDAPEAPKNPTPPPPAGTINDKANNTQTLDP